MSFVVQGLEFGDGMEANCVHWCLPSTLLPKKFDLQGCLAHKKHPPPQDHHRVLSMVLL